MERIVRLAGQPNLFLYASKELSNTAVWAWLFSQLTENAAPKEKTRTVARNLFSELDLPQPDYVMRVAVEDGLPNGGRVDIHCTYRSNNHDVTVVIENKIAKDNEVVDQVARYMNFIGQSDFVYYFIFSFDDTLENYRRSIRDKGIRLFLLERMADFFKKQDTEHDDILSHYKDFIISKHDRNQKARRALEKGEKTSDGDLYQLWTERALRQGVEDLFKSYLSFIEETNGQKEFNKGKSVAAKYEDSKGVERPIFAVWLDRSDYTRGLRIGYSENNLQKMGNSVRGNILPASFDNREHYQGRNRWRFGHVKDENELRSIWNAVGIKL